MADEPTNPPAAATPPDPTPAAKTSAVVRLALPYPHDVFRSGVKDGDAEIVVDRAGVDVPKALADQVRAAWQAAGSGRPELLEVTK